MAETENMEDLKDRFVDIELLIFCNHVLLYLKVIAITLLHTHKLT